MPEGLRDHRRVGRVAAVKGGEVVTNGQRENVDAAGNWSMPVVHTPTMPGRFLICGYTNDGATYTFTTASLSLNVQGGAAPGSSTPGPVQSPGSAPEQGTARPASVSKPRVTRSGRKLVCNRGSWSNGPIRFSYAWLVNGEAKKGARRQKLPITRKLRGRRVQCTVTASNAAGSSTVMSGRYRA